MQVPTDLLIWNDAHVQSRAKIHSVAVLTEDVVILTVPKVLLRFSSTLVTKSIKSLTPASNICVTFSSYFDCNRSLPMPEHWDYGTRCVQMTTMHSALVFLVTNNNLPNLTFLVP